MMFPSFDTARLETARQLLAKRMLWKFADHRSGTASELIPSGYAGALVLDKAPEPFRVIWNEENWDCDCPDGTAREPCAHLAALLMRMGILTDESNAADEESPLRELDGLDPEEHLLFFSEPAVSKTLPVSIFGESDGVEQTFACPTRAGGPGGVVFQDLGRKRWRIVSGEIPVREDGIYGRPRLPKSPSTEEKPASQAEAAEILLNLLRSSAALVDIHGHRWSLLEGGKVHIRFEPLLTTAGQELLFEPGVYIRTESVKGRAREHSGGLILTNDSLLALDSHDRTVVRASGIGAGTWFIRLILSRKVLSAADIRARLSRKRKTVDAIEIDEPEIPDTLGVLVPILVLDIVNRDEWTDLLPRFRYDSVMVAPGLGGDVIAAQGAGCSLIGLRDRAAENKLIREAEDILAGALSWQRGCYSDLAGNQDVPLRIEQSLNDFLSEYGAPLLAAGVEVRLENRPLHIGGAIRIKAEREGFRLDMNARIEDEDGSLSELDLDLWVEEGFVRTGEEYFLLGKKALEQLDFLRKHGMDDNGFLSTCPENLSLIDAVYSRIEADERTAIDLEQKRAAYRNLAEFSPEKTPPPPESFRGELRPYQFHGYAWLLYLRSRGLGACLADDMGLGKTVQTLAYLSRLKQDGNLGFTLLVGPVVTLANWIAEAKRFAPEFRLHRYSGPPEKRFIPESSKGADIVVVSYQTLRNDAERFLDREWDHVILDEAHYMKNASSQTFKTVRSLRAANRLSLTGTPLENHLGELWSQMSFLNPGLLGSRYDFDRLYARPIERDGETKSLERLSGVIAPFILRRHKEDVLGDLPLKDEIILRCDMTEEQTAAYKAMSDLYYQQVRGFLEHDGLEGARIQILSILSKLRLLAIHPPLAGEQFAEIPSGKMTLLDSLLDEVLSEDHKVLVFSQFLGVLDRAQRACLRRNWDFRRLTGSTRDRETPITEFMDDPKVKIFLLSLRAGGIGINLTAADYVILLDPWWNPAVEAQAVDRAHRMGQRRPVTAYKLITTGTIEEKVLELQERKKGLAAGVLGDGGMPNLCDEDILNLLGGP